MKTNERPEVSFIYDQLRLRIRAGEFITFSTVKQLAKDILTDEEIRNVWEAVERVQSMR